MCIGIENLILPEDIDVLGLNIRKFIIINLLSLAYSPDWIPGGIFEEARNEYLEYFGSAAEIADLLDKCFFDDLYVDRHEREEIKDLSLGDGLILVRGYVGAGKTVVLRKIEYEQQKTKRIRMLYFDLRQAAEDLYIEPRKWWKRQEKFELRFRDYIYDTLYDTYIYESAYLDQYLIYTINNDRKCSSVKQKLARIRGKRIKDDVDLSEIREDKQLNKILSSITERPALKTLLSFIRKKYKYSICFDNVDRCSFEEQRKIISIGLDIMRSVYVPIVIAIREANIARLITEAIEEDESNRVDQGSEIFYFAYMEKLKLGKADEIQLESLDDESVEDLLSKRLKVVQENDEFGTLDEFLSDYTETQGLENNDIETVINHYKNEFWEIYSIITETFVEDDVYQYCNHNIRGMLVTYFNFINTIMLNDEKEYRINNLLIKPHRIKKRMLRTFFYKWIICGGKLVPSDFSPIPNIFEDMDAKIPLLKLRILEYLYNWEIHMPNRRLVFNQLLDDFEYMGVNRNELSKILMELSRPQGLLKFPMIWIDKRIKNKFQDNTIIEILPSGEYFINRLSISREYVYWSAASVKLPFELITKGTPISKTYEDNYKYEAVFKFLTEILYPSLENEINFVESHSHRMGELKIERTNYHRKWFGIDHRLYLNRVINNIMNSFEYSDLENDELRDYREKYGELLRRVEKLEKLTVHQD